MEVVLDPEKVKERVTLARLHLGLTRPEFARLVGVDIRTFDYWDAGTKDPGLRSIRRIAEATGRPISWFLGLEEPEEIAS